MPNSFRVVGPYIPSKNGSPDELAQPLSAAGTPGDYTDYAPGEKGSAFQYQDKTYQLVVCDSGATSATPTGVVTANQLAFWKDYGKRLVTNDMRMCVSPTDPSSCVAGVFRKTLSAAHGAGGTLMAVLLRGKGVRVAAGTTAIGPMVADTTAGQARVVTVTGTRPVLGFARVADSGGSVANADIDIPSLP